MFIHSLICITTIFLVANGLTAIEGIELNDQTVRSNWEAVERTLNKQKIIRLCKETLNEESLNRILSLQLPSLQQLHFTQDLQKIPDGYRRPMLILTQRLVRTIFTSSYFPRISVLNLDSVAIDDRSLRFLEDIELTTTLEKLNLRKNLIGKDGYQYLSRVQFLNLKALNLELTLLIQTEAVDSLVRIICGRQAGKCRNNLEDLNIARTNINRDNFIRLMMQINPDSLQQLNINYLSLIYNGTYNDAFIYSSFEALTIFNNLQNLSIEGSELDDTAAIIFANWTLPFLTTLNIQKNHLSDKGIMTWITKLNMPKLIHLNLNKNEIEDETIFHLASEDFEFETLQLIQAKFTADGIEKLNLLDTRMLKKLEIGFNMPTKILNSFIQEDDFPNLEQLIIKDNDLFVNVFTKINWKKLPKLNYLSISSINLRSSIEELLQNTTLSIPTLKQLTLVDTQMDDYYSLYFLTTINIAFPKLQYLIIRELEDIIILPDILWSLQINEGVILEFDSNKMIKRRNCFQIISLTQPEFLFLSSNQQQMSPEAIINRIPDIARLYDFTNMEALGFDSIQITIYFFRLLKQIHITSLPRLRQFAFFFRLPNEMLLDFIGNIQMPCLRALIISFIIPSDTQEDEIQQNLYPFFANKPLLQALYLHISFLNEQNGDLQTKEFTSSLYFPFMFDVQMYGMNMELQEIQHFVRMHNQTIRILNFGNNFLEKGFLQLLADQGYALQGLSLSSTSFTVDEFAILGKMKTQYLSTLILSQNDLTNQHIYAMMSQRGDRPLFPRLRSFNIQGNDIRKEGLEALLKSELLMMNELSISQNRNPQYINLLFTYPTKISSIQALQVDVYGLKTDLNPKAARSLNQLYLKTKSFISEDFANLAKLDFSQLRIAVFDIHNVYDCQTLQNLIQITKEALLLFFYFHNDVKGLNSTCLKNSKLRSHTCCLNIYDDSGTTYLPQFAEALLNTDSQIKQIMLIDTKFPPQLFRKFFTQSSFGQLQLLTLVNNYVGDEIFKIFLNSDLSNLEFLILVSIDITDASIQGLSMAKLPALKQLALNGNKLGKRAMQNLKKMKADKLLGLYLCNCGIKADSLSVISSFKMPELSELFLSNNDFQEDEAVEFVSDIQRKNFPSLAYIQMKGISLSKVNYDSIVQILQAKGIRYSLDKPHNTYRGNSAKY